MKKLISLFVFLAFIGCDNNVEEPEQEEAVIKIHAFYTAVETGNNKYPDYGSKVFIYYDIYSMDIAGYSYEDEGRFIHRGDTILPQQKSTIDIDGNAILFPTYTDRKITIVVESYHYPGRLATASYSDITFPTYGNIDVTLTTNP
ncbi:MAG: hypothetical protein LBO74_04200 [Candidatus Symbiothrix sp.]|jgi:hypothetical protein|nr:hypothetical protein [Candidatus Symbiothrix sp.]